MEKHTASHASITWVFATLVIILSIPLILFSTQQKQDIRQFASPNNPTPVPSSQKQTNGFISGYIYLDQNKNGERDYLELGMKNIQLKISHSPGLISTISTDDNGFFKYRYNYQLNEQATLSIELNLPPDYKTINTNPVELKADQNNPKNILEFGIFPIQNNFNTQNYQTQPLPTIFKYIQP